MKKARLGRGLDALLGDDALSSPGPRETLRQLPVEQLKRGRYQPRGRMSEESLAELAGSIRSQGVVQPVVVRETDDGGFEILAGERRWRAAQMAGLDTVPAVVRNVPDEAAVAMALIENIQREDLNPIEEASGVQRLLDEFGLTHQQVAERIGRSRAAVSNLLRLLGLNPRVRAHVEQGKLGMGHARALLALPPERQVEAAARVVGSELSVRQTERMVRRMLSPDEPERSTGGRTRSRDIERLEEEVSQRVGARVRIEDRAGTGRLVISYHTLEELEGILAHIK